MDTGTEMRSREKLTFGRASSGSPSFPRNPVLGGAKIKARLESVHSLLKPSRLETKYFLRPIKLH